MYEEKIKDLLNNVKENNISIDEAFMELKKLPFEDIGFAKIDHHREIRTGYPEVIFAQGKTSDQVAKIFKILDDRKRNVMATRATLDNYNKVLELCPNAKFCDVSRIIYSINEKKKSSNDKIAIITAGTADIPVAEEAALTCEIMGNEVMRIFDVGVAGIHRLFARIEEIRSASVLIVVAGMEGALTSVVGGLVDKPVIAVPTSVGYGASFEGLSALLTMLNSCASGVGVVNIDNGFGAAYLASMINRKG